MSLRPRFASVVLAFLLAGCADDLGPTSARLENSVHALLGGLEVGEALMLTGEEAAAVYLAGGAEGAEYLYVPFFAAEAGQARLQVEVEASNVAATSPFELGPDRVQRVRAEEWRLDHERHEARLERAARELEPRLPLLRAGADLSRGPQASAARAAVPPQTGAIVPLNIAASCAAEDADVRYGRVAAVGETAILVADTANPVDGMTQADYLAFARQFDELVLPTLTRHFGEPSDLDRNDRVVVFFTRAVNELTPPNSASYVGGFFWAGDLYPRQICPGSNEAEIFYQLVADPLGEVNGNVFPTEFVRESTLGVIGHELQHLINASRRIYANNAEALERTWLDEGLSHVAEELLFYAASGLGPGQNLDLETILSSEATRRAANAFLIDNLARFASYLEQPEEESLLGIDNLETRGAAWAFLRYAADQDARPDEEIFRELVNSRIAGTESLATVFGTDVIDLMQAWTVSVYTDDYLTTADPRYQQPSWNFRSLVSALYYNERFPLRVHALGPERGLSLRLRGGGAAFATLRGLADRQAVVATTSGGQTPPDRLRASILRIR